MEGSSLEAMFSGRHQIEDSEGFVHLSRNPDIFKLVIEYLASGLKMPEIDDDVQKMLF